MSETKHTIRELTGCKPDQLGDNILCSTEPLLLRGLVADWPFVKAGLKSVDGADQYLRRFYKGAAVTSFYGAPELGGRVFYNQEMTAPNTKSVRSSFTQVLDKLKEIAADDNPPLLYMGSTTVDTCLPGFRGENDVEIPGYDPLVSIWVGNQSRIAAHHDLPENIACVAVGRRRFTLFPPDQVSNLYIGPLDVTPAGQSISMVDFKNPDFERFPKFRQALDQARVVEMEPGDALFIPSMWWHHVEALDPFNILVNYWWRRTPEYMGPPIGALIHSIMTIRDLPPEQKQHWKAFFDHYVFENDDQTAGHLPLENQGILGPMTDDLSRKIRTFLLNKLNN